MRGKRLVSILILALLVLPLAAKADGLAPGQRPPRNEQSEVFVELYKDGITTWDSAYDRVFETAGQIVLWRYPGSGQVEGAIKSGFQNSLPEKIQPSEVFSPCYVDGAGRVWGYLGYFYGYRMVWVCVSDPANENLPADAEMVAAVDKGVTAMLWRERAPLIALVVGVVAVTGGLLYVFWFKKKKRG